MLYFKTLIGGLYFVVLIECSYLLDIIFKCYRSEINKIVIIMLTIIMSIINVVVLFIVKLLDHYFIGKIVECEIVRSNSINKLNEEKMVIEHEALRNLQLIQLFMLKKDYVNLEHFFMNYQ